MNGNKALTILCIGVQNKYKVSSFIKTILPKLRLNKVSLSPGYLTWVTSDNVITWAEYKEGLVKKWSLNLKYFKHQNADNNQNIGSNQNVGINQNIRGNNNQNNEVIQNTGLNLNV